MDLISRQAAIDAVENAFDRETILNRFVRKIAISAIRLLPSAQPEPHWISCSERLPLERTNPNTLDFERVLCSTTFGDVRAYKFGKPMGHSEPHFWHGAGLVDEYVAAWMPLPEPYKEEKA